ncbi:MAG: hypothetical protein WKG06_30025 [Segetibacter sp.]
MKNSLFAFVATCIASLAVTNGAYAQTAINIEVLEIPKNVIKTGKDISPEKNNTVNLNTISLKAVKDFKKSYKMVSDENWFIRSDGFNARFTLNGINNLIYYNKKGKWVGSLKVYSEDKLPRDIRDIVKREYYDYKITSVNEIETTLDTYGIPTYIVNLKDNNNIKLIRVRDGEMDVYQEFKSNND